MLYSNSVSAYVDIYFVTEYLTLNQIKASNFLWCLLDQVLSFSVDIKNRWTRNTCIREEFFIGGEVVNYKNIFVSNRNVANCPFVQCREIYFKIKIKFI